jgi:transcriptional regulator with XRE-family HTH domain
MKRRNFIGRQVGRLRSQQGWTQDIFADKLQLAGWHEATRSTVSKIEDGSLRIDLTQLLYLAWVLRVQPSRFLSEIDWSKPIDETIHKLIPQENSRQTSPVIGEKRTGKAERFSFFG